MNYRVLFGVALCAALPGCFIDGGDSSGPAPGPAPAPVADTGSLVLDWTVDGTKDPDQCDQGAAAAIDVTVTAADGSPAGEFQQSCRAFATSIDLPRGSYTADAVLLDSSGQDRTTPVQVRPFDILGGDELTIPIDFSAGSFLAP
jgi:hypothetical protein